MAGGSQGETGSAPLVGRAELLRHIGDGLIGSGQIGFIDDDQVGNFQNTGLFPLQFVAGLRLQNENDDVRHVTNRDVSLAGSDGFDKDAIEAERFHYVQHQIDVWRDSLLPGYRRQASDKDAIGRGSTGDAASITQQRAASYGTLGIAGEYTHALATLGNAVGGIVFVAGLKFGHIMTSER